MKKAKLEWTKSTLNLKRLSILSCANHYALASKLTSANGIHHCSHNSLSLHPQVANIGLTGHIPICLVATMTKKLVGNLQETPHLIQRWLVHLEESFNCSGLCQTPTFWISKPVTDGPPPNACVFNLKDRFNKSGGALAYATTATTFIIFCIFIVHYGLYLVDPAEVKNRKKRFIFDN